MADFLLHALARTAETSSLALTTTCGRNLLGDGDPEVARWNQPSVKLQSCSQPLHEKVKIKTEERGEDETNKQPTTQTKRRIKKYRRRKNSLSCAADSFSFSATEGANPPLGAQPRHLQGPCDAPGVLSSPHSKKQQLPFCWETHFMLYCFTRSKRGKED